MTGVSKRSTGPRTTVPTSTVPASVSRAVRTAVLWVPDWPVVAAMAAGQAEVHQSVAVHDGRRITAVSALARTQGVRRGMRRRQAQECCPELVLLTVDGYRFAGKERPRRAHHHLRGLVKKGRAEEDAGAGLAEPPATA